MMRWREEREGVVWFYRQEREGGTSSTGGESCHSSHPYAVLS